jgi:hypothetical protein
MSWSYQFLDGNPDSPIVGDSGAIQNINLRYQSGGFVQLPDCFETTLPPADRAIQERRLIATL